MRIESGPATERVRRTAIMTVVVVAIASWFAYDGWVNYPGQNSQWFLSQYPRGSAPATAPIDARVTPALAERLKGAKPADVEKELGAAPLKHESGWWWFGPTGALVVSPGGGAAFHGAPKGAMDLLLQRVIAVLLGVVGIGMAVQLVRIRGARYTLDDAGLSGLTATPIRWEQMTRLDGQRVDEKGWVDLHYDADGRPRKVRLDSYAIAAFGEIIDRICEKKGFENPLPVRAGGAES
ncbi:MAG: hypothetical protein U1A27_06385 [Phycisphaerae bacterium]